MLLIRGNCLIVLVLPKFTKYRLIVNVINIVHDGTGSTGASSIEGAW